MKLKIMNDPCGIYLKGTGFDQNSVPLLNKREGIRFTTAIKALPRNNKPMKPILITVGERLPLIIIPEIDAHMDGHPVLAYTYLIFRIKHPVTMA